MTNMLALVLIVAIGYWVITIISRKKRELEQKELQQAEQFLKETQALLKEETSPSLKRIHQLIRTVKKLPSTSKPEGYNITEISKAEGIDLIGIKDKALVLIRCEEKLKEIKKVDIKLFIAECSVYVDNNPMFKGRSCTRVFATNRPITEEVSLYLRDNPSSVRLLEEI